MTLPLPPGLLPMEAETRAAIPRGEGWQYEPKWDGFRCLALRDGDAIELRSKAGKPLARYFPEVVEALRSLGARRFALDGELLIAVDGRLSFDALLQRIHPALSRVARLAAETPAVYTIFDLLLAERGAALLERPLRERRPRLERFAERYFGRPDVRLSPATVDAHEAERWLRAGAGLDGVIAKQLDEPYRAGERAGMVKVKHLRTADCVVGGFRYASRGRIVGSLLLGLHDDEGSLHHVGFTSTLAADERKKLTPRLEKLRAPPGFTGRAPGGPSRWSTERSTEWEPLRPELVVEVQYDHFTGGRFRHGTKFLRWRPDKDPAQCTFDQLEVPAAALEG